MKHSLSPKYYFFIIAIAFSFLPLLGQVKEATIPYAARYDLPKVLDESSGLLFWNGKLWSHNDSSGADSIYSFSPNNPTDFTAYWVGAPNRDWEAIEQDDDYFYIGDFGNNARGNRTDLRIFKVSKESILSGVPAVDTIFFSYVDQTDFTRTSKPESTEFDCEAFIITTDSIYLFTKKWISHTTTMYALPKTHGTHIAKYITTYNTKGLVTDAAYLPKKRILALCGYSANYLRQFMYVFYDFKGTNFFSGKVYKFNLNVGLVPHQIEGLATVDGNTYYATNEYTPVSPQRLHVFDVSRYFESYMKLPETAVQIIGPNRVCHDNPVVTYTVEPIANAESYEWILSKGLKGKSNTNSITVQFDTLSAYQTIGIRAKNAHGYGGTTNLTVMVNAKPRTPVITLANREEKILRSSHPDGNQWYDQHGRIRGATSQTYKVNSYGDYYVRLTLNGCTSDRSNVISTDAYVPIYYEPIFNIDYIPARNTEKIHAYLKNNPPAQKKKRKFLFWYR